MLRLITIPISHYCEKARWALDRAGIAYREERHVQLVHRVAARRAGGGSTVPVLVSDGVVLGDSSAILTWVDERTPAGRRLFPAERGSVARAEVDALCRRFDEKLGPTGRRLIYVHMLEQRELALSFNNTGVPAWENHVLRLTWPLAAEGVRRALGIRPGMEVDDERAVWAEFDVVAERLADGRPFLCGDAFGAADLTFAALASPVIAPPQYGTALPQPEVMTPATAALIDRAREHPAGQFAMRMFAEHRCPSRRQSAHRNPVMQQSDQTYMSPGALSDLNSSSNQNHHIWIFCGSMSTTPGCQNAPSAPQLSLVRAGSVGLPFGCA